MDYLLAQANLGLGTLLLWGVVAVVLLVFCLIFFNFFGFHFFHYTHSYQVVTGCIVHISYCVLMVI